MFRFISFISVFIFSFNAYSIPETKMLNQTLKLLDAGQIYQMGEFKSRFRKNLNSEKLQIRFTKYGHSKGPLGSLVIAPGRTEDSLKYLEVAYDFIQRGYSPVYALDHRGQGFSDRSLEDMQKGHVEDFNFYILDFNTFVNDIVLKDKDVNTDRLFLISNSMGGAISAAYLQKYPNHPFKASAFFSAMFKILYPEGVNELKAHLLGVAVCLLGIEYQGASCKDYAPGRGPFDWKDRVFKDNELTHSWARFEYRNELWKRYPKIALGGSTVQWVGQAALANMNLRSVENVKKIRIPMHVYSAELDSIVDNEGHKVFCKRAKNLCRHFTVKGARHEILMEKDSLRSPAMNSMWEFFEKVD